MFRTVFNLVLDSETAAPCGATEFHVARHVREKYGLEVSLFSSTGNVIFADFRAAREFAQKLNAARDLVRHPEQAVRAGQLNAMGLLDEILHYVVAQYREQVNRPAFERALAWLNANVGAEALERTLVRFVEEFPPLAVFRGELGVTEYLSGTTAGRSNREIALEELLLLWLSNANPALTPFLELFDDTGLQRTTAYPEVVEELRRFFETQPRFGPDNQTLVDLLRSAALASPDSIEGQLRFVRERWGWLLQPFLVRLLRSLDLVREETRPVFPGPAPSEVLRFGEGEEEPERFSPDLDWMPKLVLMAKSTLVWLDQLSKKYQRAITRLDQIPDEELDLLARWGFTGLWLIGVWERSPASREIKRHCGNPEAEASAYSLFDYEIAGELGGWDALYNLRERCWRRGIRLASDMVPNHTGLDSRWIREHPDWFISLPYSPFPNYTFTGPNYSGDPRYGIFIEDKYYERTDAAVVFKRVDYWTGDERYIYHGNDGTGMPWNDTAQLNYLLPEVREAVIQKILHVARAFPVIRFDAAMTLTKRHYQRLWFPEPGQGGDIPSRAEHGLTKEEFDRLMPNEFWREVVDRVAQEAPDTLLLAEAFWLMEGYFVRTLGMHRVYNSAFMNMLKDEENDKFRSTVRNTIQFNPEILKRFVNFMNNPDEETAVVQFGKGDKYFGVCTMMVTMPGLPMFGHGQVEGFREKYGMEYRKAYLDEQPDWDLVQRHEREIFPLMKKRYLFAEVENFLLYDLVTPEGYVDEDVFAYSNRRGDERALVVYHNKFKDTRGWIQTSVPYAVKDGGSGEVRFVQKSLGQGLALPDDPRVFCLFRDHLSGLEFIRNCRELHERGLYVELGAYKCHVFLEFRQVADTEDGRYARLCDHLQGHGVPNLHQALTELTLQPLLQAFDALLHSPVAEALWPNRKRDGGAVARARVQAFEARYRHLLEQARAFSGGQGNVERLARAARRRLEAALRLSGRRARKTTARKYEAALRYVREHLAHDPAAGALLFAWLVVHDLGRVRDAEGAPQLSRIWLDEWLLGQRLERWWSEAGLEVGQVSEALALLKVLVTFQDWYADEKPARGRAWRILNRLFQSEEVQQFLRVNRFNGVLWFNKERFERFVAWLFTTAAVLVHAHPDPTRDQKTKRVAGLFGVVQSWLQAETASGYQVESLLALLEPARKRSGPGRTQRLKTE